MMDKYNDSLELLYNIRRALGIAIECIEERENLIADRDYWQHAHAEVVNQSIRHGEEMMGNVLLALIKKETPSNDANTKQ